jgi:hypothetical protein
MHLVWILEETWGQVRNSADLAMMGAKILKDSRWG